MLNAKGFKCPARLRCRPVVGREGEMQNSLWHFDRHGRPGMDFGKYAAAQRVLRECLSFGILILFHNLDSWDAFGA
jgi:hypothetical protein